jgi:hypothetical protein
VTAYILDLTEADVRDIEFVGARYAWAEAFLDLEVGENALSEPEAWRIKDAIERDIEGGHTPFPMLDPRSRLYEKLTTFWSGIV